MEHTTEETPNTETENTINAALSVDSESSESELVETPSQQQDDYQLDEASEEWELHPNFPAEQDLLYPGQEMLEMELEFLDDEKQEDTLWQARTGLNFESLCGAIETVIFMSDKPVGINKIKALIDEDMPLRVIHESIMRLQDEYEQKHHGLRLVEVADGYQFRTKATYSKYVQDLFKVNSLVLSPTALEVLAIIAYKQPVAKTEVDKIRGVDSGHIVRGLMDKRLVKVAGRSDEMGRPVLYATTPEFMEVFNLANLNELPPEQELEESIENNIGKISDIKTIVHDGDKARFVFDDIDELDSLAASIKQISADTEFTQALKNQEKEKIKELSGDSRSDDSDATSSSTEEKPRVLTAFDILEDYVSKQVIINANQEATGSEMMSDSADPIVISDITEGPFNTPELNDDDEEDFQMIDLDTGLPIVDEEMVATETELGTDLEEEQIQGIDLLGENQSEADELAKALDDAFERLTGEKLEDGNEIELLAHQDKTLDEREDELFQKAEEISEMAKGLDLDLSFLKENQVDMSSFEDEDQSSENSTDS